MSTLQANLPVNDSLRVRYSVRNADGTLLSLAGFTGELVVKATPTSAAPAIVTVAGVLQNPDTSFLFSIPPDTLTDVGTLYATVRAYDLDESYSETFFIITTDHA